MMEKKRIGIDIDDVVVEMMKHFLDYSNLKNNTSFSIEEVTSYYLWETRIHPSKEESIKEFIEFQNSVYFDKIDLVEGVKEIINHLSKTHSVYFITSRSAESDEKNSTFFRKHFPENNFKIIYSGEVYGGKFKPEICSDLEIPIMIEDNPYYALDCARKGIRVFLIDKPWNKNHEPHENLLKVKDWNEILPYLK